MSDPSASSGSSAHLTVLGIDDSGHIIQCGPGIRNMVGRDPEEVLAQPIGCLVADADDHKETLAALVEAARSGTEWTATLPVRTGNGSLHRRPFCVQPMSARDGRLAAAVLIGPCGAAHTEERFPEPEALHRTLLDEGVRRIGTSLDLDQTAHEIVDVVVPDFCNAAGVLVLESLVGADDVPGKDTHGSALLRRLAVKSDDDNPAWLSAFPVGEVLGFPPGTPYARCLARSRPVHEASLPAGVAEEIARAWQRGPVADLLSGVSMLVLPLTARGTTLGLIVCVRKTMYRRFDTAEIATGVELAARAAVHIDNARRYSREHATALTLQRSLLPTDSSAPDSVEVAHRYLPGSRLIEIGGDWYEAIALPGARVGLVVGDVAGHGIRAAVTMGRLRTALRTLANLELSAAEALQHLDELMRTFNDAEPYFATCTYAIYDAVSGTCEIASAGHLPPLLVRPDGSNELLDIPPGPPLGTGARAIESREIAVDDGSLFVLYTDGLVESRGRDIDDGLRRLRRIFGPGSPSRPLDDLCTQTLGGVCAEHNRDDIALLIARLRRIPDDRHVAWTLPAEQTAVRAARGLVRAALERWGLAGLSGTTELLVSELITNALRYAAGDVKLRLLRERSLVCEVFDRSAALPRLRYATRDDETGRGLQIVAQFSHRWGTRRTAAGKVVWCEQLLPDA